MLPPWGQFVRSAFFTNVGGSDCDWKCKCGTVRKQNGTGYTNLTSHVRDKHPDDYQKLRSESGQPSHSSESAPSSLFFNRKTLQMHGWVDLVVAGLLPFSAVENPTYRRHVRYDPISRRDTHYVACYASYSSNTERRFSLALLGFSPLEEELSQSAQYHYKYLTFVLELFGKDFSNVVSIVGDNCSSNKALADLLGVRYSDVPVTVTTSAKLRAHTHLRAKCHTVTRWSSTAAMMERYQQIKGFLPELGIEEIIDLMPAAREERALEKLLEKFKDFDSVTKTLQRDNISCSEVRALFDGMIDAYPSTKARLSANAKIVHSPNFESGLVKIQENRISQLSA
eukprot:IDg21796t1